MVLRITLTWLLLCHSPWRPSGHNMSLLEVVAVPLSGSYPSFDGAVASPATSPTHCDTFSYDVLLATLGPDCDESDVAPLQPLAFCFVPLVAPSAFPANVPYTIKVGPVIIGHPIVSLPQLSQTARHCGNSVSPLQSPMPSASPEPLL